jgi:hypothetical protein
MPTARLPCNAMLAELHQKTGDCCVAWLPQIATCRKVGTAQHLLQLQQQQKSHCGSTTAAAAEGELLLAAAHGAAGRLAAALAVADSSTTRLLLLHGLTCCRPMLDESAGWCGLGCRGSR